MKVVNNILEKIGIKGVGFRIDLEACLFGVEMREVTIVKDGKEIKGTLFRFWFGPFGIAVIV